MGPVRNSICNLPKSGVCLGWLALAAFGQLFSNRFNCSKKHRFAEVSNGRYVDRTASRKTPIIDSNQKGDIMP